MTNEPTPNDPMPTLDEQLDAINEPLTAVQRMDPRCEECNSKHHSTKFHGLNSGILDQILIPALIHETCDAVPEPETLIEHLDKVVFESGLVVDFCAICNSDSHLSDYHVAHQEEFPPGFKCHECGYKSWTEEQHLEHQCTATILSPASNHADLMDKIRKRVNLAIGGDYDLSRVKGNDDECRELAQKLVDEIDVSITSPPAGAWSQENDLGYEPAKLKLNTATEEVQQLTKADGCPECGSKPLGHNEGCSLSPTPYLCDSCGFAFEGHVCPGNNAPTVEVHQQIAPEPWSIICQTCDHVSIDEDYHFTHICKKPDPKPTPTFDSIVFMALGEASALFMSNKQPGVEQVMPTKDLDAIGHRLIDAIVETYDRANNQQKYTWQRGPGNVLNYGEAMDEVSGRAPKPGSINVHDECDSPPLIIKD